MLAATSTSGVAWIGRFVVELMHHWPEISIEQSSTIGKVMAHDADFRSLVPEDAAQQLVFDF